MAAVTEPDAIEGDTVVRASIINDGDTMKVLQQASRFQDGEGRYDYRNNSDQPSSLRACPSIPIRPLISELSNPTGDILRLWNCLRFVRMGWLTAREAVSYVDL